MSIVTFTPNKVQEDAILVCSCGCASFELTPRGEAICRGCYSLAGEDSAWLSNLPTASAVYQGSQVSFADGGNCDDFSERKCKRGAMNADWLIFGNYEGRVQSWCREFIDTPEREKWFSDSVAVGLKAILEDKPR